MYRTWTCRSVAALALLAGSWSGVAGTIDQSLEELLATKSPDEQVSTLVFLQGQVDVHRLNAELRSPRMTARARHEVVVTTLQAAAWSSQGALLNHLHELEQAGRVSHWHAYWLSNAIRVDAPVAEILALAARDDVGIVYYNYEIELERPAASPAAGDETDGPRTPEPGLVAIRAPEVWAMGYTGNGVLVATLDTGVEGTHPALASRWRGLDPLYAGHPQWAWFDPVTNTTFPAAFGAHGTHTMGTVCGGAPGDQIGVAPGAQWIHAAVIDRVSISQTVADALAAFEWMVDPDGNPNTDYDVPAVCSNSWRLVTGHGYPPCDQTFWTHLDAVEAAGTVILFSAGNEGPGAETIGRPPDRATDEYRTFSVGAVDGNQSSWPIASFSSRGPSHCTPDGSAAIKPEVSAPGVDVRSAVPGGGYQGGWSGTSMASPHVNGVVALMKEACPDLTVEQYKQILIATAHDLGTTGNDNSYGWGMVDAYEAVLMAISLCGPKPPEAQDVEAVTGVNTAATITVTAEDDGEPNPPGMLSYIVVSKPTHGQLRDPQGDAITAVPYTLLNNGNQILYTPNAYFDGYDTFTFKANDGGVPPDGGDSNIASVLVTVGGPQTVYSWNLDTDPGWTRTGLWGYGVPQGQGGENGFKDPNSAFTGAKVLGYNLYGDYSNNIGERHVTTGAFDCSGLRNVGLRFRRWLGVEKSSKDHAYIRVSTNGVSFTTVWENPDADITDNGWTVQTVDLSAYADDQPAVYVRWTMGAANSSKRFCGWNIDDVEVRSYAPATVLAGDANCDGVVDFDDIPAFVLMLTDLPAWQAQYPDCDWRNGDCEPDGVVNFDDINRFVLLLQG